MSYFHGVPIYRIDARHTEVQCVRFLLRVDRIPDGALNLQPIMDNLRDPRAFQGAEFHTGHRRGTARHFPILASAGRTTLSKTPLVGLAVAVTPVRGRSADAPPDPLPQGSSQVQVLLRIVTAVTRTV